MAAQALRRETPAYRRFPRLVETGPIAPSTKALCGQAVRVFGLEIRDTTLDEAASWLVSRAKSALATNVAFVNAHSINVINRDVRFADAVTRFHCVFADGIGLRLAARAGGVTLRDNVNGTDLFPILCGEAAREDVWVYLLGSAEGVSDAAARNMTRAHPGLTIAGTASGYFATTAEEDAAIEAINASGAEILLVGMGVPAQEKWIFENRHRLKPSVVIGVGGLFDYYSGNIARAPMWMRKNGLEWVWRLSLEPTRLARRYLLGNAEFMMRLVTHRMLSPQLFDQTADSSPSPTPSAAR